MRTTINVDEDVLLAAQEIARRQQVSVGKVVSDLVRQALNRVPETDQRNGVPLFPERAGGVIVTPELVNQLRDETP